MDRERLKMRKKRELTKRGKVSRVVRADSTSLPLILEGRQARKCRGEVVGIWLQK